jgi:hypothetical protein
MVIIEGLNELIVPIRIKHVNQAVAASSCKETQSRKRVGKVEAGHIGLMGFNIDNLLERLCFEDSDVAEVIAACKLTSIVCEFDAAKPSLPTSLDLDELILPHPLKAVLAGHDEIKLNS